MAVSRGPVSRFPVSALTMPEQMIGSAVGTSTVTAVGAALSPAAGACAATSSITGVGASTFTASGAASGTSTTAAVGRETARAFPTNDVSIGDWTDQTDGTTDLYSVLDELSVDDADYVKSSLLITGEDDTLELALPPLGDAELSTGHSITYRYKKDGSGTINLTVSLVQGTTVIASWTHTGVGASFITATQELSGAEADAITDYTDLRLRFAAAA